MDGEGGQTVRASAMSLATRRLLGVGLQPRQVARDPLQRVSRALGRHREVIRIANRLQRWRERLLRFERQNFVTSRLHLLSQRPEYSNSSSVLYESQNAHLVRIGGEFAGGAS